MDSVESPVALRRKQHPGNSSRCGLEFLPEVRCGGSVSRYGSPDGLTEWHVIVQLSHDSNNPAETLENRWLETLADAEIAPATTVFRRFFCSDVINQRPSLERFAHAWPGACSMVGQPPANGRRLAVASYHLADAGAPLPSEGRDGCFTIKRGPMRHAWLCGISSPSGADAAVQCRAVLDRHDEALSALGMSLGNDVIRTWWYLRDVDNDYPGFVDARKEAFLHHDLTPDRHYIASTGIAGAPAVQYARLMLDSYAVGGLDPGQVQYLTAPDHLGPSHNYGVTFERATAVSYADRRQVFISGTASIDPNGAIVHPGDVIRQLDRALENIAALLVPANGRLEQLAMMLVYLRDPADAARVDARLRARFPRLPMLILHAPVCRPGWLVEVEGIAILTSRNPELPDF